MQRYFFDLFNDADTEDHEGSVLLDDTVALDRARRYALEMAAESLKQHGHVVMSHKIVVRSEAGFCFTVRFGDVVSIED